MRVRDRHTFAALARGRRARRGPLAVTFLVKDGTAAPAVAYAISRRVGTAVTRNRLRRQLRSLIAARALRAGAYLVSVSPDARGSSAAELARWLDAALLELGVLEFGTPEGVAVGDA